MCSDTLAILYCLQCFGLSKILHWENSFRAITLLELKKKDVSGWTCKYSDTGIQMCRHFVWFPDNGIYERHFVISGTDVLNG